MSTIIFVISLFSGGAANVTKFLDDISWYEGADYNTLFGGRTFTGTAHPNICVKYKNTCSTAAGRYQILHRTWKECVRAGVPNTFDKQGQDICALYLIKRKNALTDILNGNFKQARKKLSSTWPSFKIRGDKYVVRPK